jgi:hypothetical protein
MTGVCVGMGEALQKNRSTKTQLTQRIKPKSQQQINPERQSPQIQGKLEIQTWPEKEKKEIVPPARTLAVKRQRCWSHHRW